MRPTSIGRIVPCSHRYPYEGTFEAWRRRRSIYKASKGSRSRQDRVSSAWAGNRLSIPPLPPMNSGIMYVDETCFAENEAVSSIGSYALWLTYFTHSCRFARYNSSTSDWNETRVIIRCNQIIRCEGHRSMPESVLLEYYILVVNLSTQVSKVV